MLSESKGLLYEGSATTIKDNEQDNNWLETGGHEPIGQETCDGKREGEEEGGRD